MPIAIDQEFVVNPNQNHQSPLPRRWMKKKQLQPAAVRRPVRHEEQRHKEEGSRQKVDGSNQDVCPPFSPKFSSPNVLFPPFSPQYCTPNNFSSRHSHHSRTCSLPQPTHTADETSIWYLLAPAYNTAATTHSHKKHL